MGKSRLVLDNEVRNNVMEVIRNALAQAFETDVDFVDNGSVMMPVVDSEYNEKFAVISVAIPRGKRDGKGGYIPYNGYAEAEAYRIDCETRQAEDEAKAANKRRAEKEKERKRNARKLVKELNEKGLDKIIKEGE